MVSISEGKIKRHQLLSSLHRKLRTYNILRRTNCCQSGSLYKHLEKRTVYQIEKITKTRYVHERSNYRKCKELFASFQRDLDSSEQCWIKDYEFKVKYGMKKESLEKLHEYIKNHEVFRRRPRGRPQAKSKYQLMVFLSYVQMEGVGMSNERGRQQFGIGSGTCELYRKRVLKAIYQSLFHKTVYWPDQEERIEISSAFEKMNNLPNTVGVIDGTLLPLAFKPCRIDYPDFKGRKHLYSLTMLVVNDHKRRIRYYNTGFPGSVHDERVLNNSKIARSHSEFFSPTEYILGDTAYSSKSYIISSFKKARGGQLSREQEIFNNTVSKVRIMSEHTIGLLKCRFPFLRSIRFLLRDGEQGKQDMKKILQYVTVCIILHNLLIGLNDEYAYTSTDDTTSDLLDHNELNDPLPEGAADGARREQLKQYLLERFH